MNPEDFPSPGYVANGHRLRQEALRAVNYARVQADLSPGSSAGDDLRKFFVEAAKLCPKAKKDTP